MAKVALAGHRSRWRPLLLLGLLGGLFLLYAAIYRTSALQVTSQSSTQDQAPRQREVEGPVAIGQSSGGSSGGGGSETPATVAKSDAAEEGDALLPAPSLTPEQLKERCAGTLGSWCKDYLLQRPMHKKAPPRGNKSCLWNCNFVGVCDHLAGWCRCPAGWTGDDCSTRLRRPCSYNWRRHGFEPFDKPVNYSQTSESPSRCSQLCDEDIGLCFCNSTMEYGRIPAGLQEPPGTPVTKRGRPMSQHCQPNANPDTGKQAFFGTRPPEELFGPEGWCRAKSPAMNDPCPCILDGYCGQFCDDVCETFCPNQCGGHGECLSGWCKCHEGWWGQDCAYRTEGTQWAPGVEEQRPWLKDLVHTPAAKDPEPGDTRNRPLIFVYELPSIFNNKLLQYRPDKGCCTHRFFQQPDNASLWNDPWVYAAESGLHEALLQSEHRTLNPEEADFYYLPIYSSCYIWPLHADNDSPFFHSSSRIPRVFGTINMLIEVHNWIRSHHPWWDRNGGRDHIVLQTHDEGSCWLPAVLRPAILLAHWGRTDRNHVSHTGFWPDNYTANYFHSVYMPEGAKHKLGDFACYDPAKDLIIPPMTSSLKYKQSPLVGAPSQERTIRAFFKGRTQQKNPPYSRGIRQKLENLCTEQDWWGKHRVWVGESMPPDTPKDLSYSQALSTSTFCFALPGDGWSARMEDAIQHGCIPVIIQDEVHLAFESILDFSAFSLRIPQSDLERVPEIIGAVTPERVAQLQTGLAAVWRRYAYSGYRPYTALTLHHRAQHAAELAAKTDNATSAAAGPQPLEPQTQYDPREMDALETIYSWLHSRIAHTRGALSGAQQEVAQRVAEAEEAARQMQREEAEEGAKKDPQRRRRRLGQEREGEGEGGVLARLEAAIASGNAW